MTVVDASVWIDYLAGHHNPQADWLDDQLSIGTICVPDLTVCEVLQGVRTASDFERTKGMLLGFTSAAVATQELCIMAAQNYRLMREQGVTIRSTIDCLIATFCIQNDHTLLHRDRDFDHFEQHLGLKAVKV
jgi:predicted nucleic acid-binding protein